MSYAMVLYIKAKFLIRSLTQISVKYGFVCKRPTDILHTHHLRLATEYLALRWIELTSMIAITTGRVYCRVYVEAWLTNLDMVARMTVQEMSHTYASWTVIVLQEAAKVVKPLVCTNLCAIHAKRVSIVRKEIQLVREIRRERT
ncbi:unnamed protein product [Angiostrongylus costaricensis]|uniref:Histone domain-containing protein n=1 Tax=Angiostrongylus costaricensis TaxID=334426 RepID=A0A158PFM4_ANGCS|nr:unnamed protein product [Angiostrongylus costaricensis]